MGRLADLVNPPRRKALTARGRKTIENRIARLIKQLRDAGYDDGRPITGVFGPRDLAAIRKYEGRNA
jgi:peptidoglycan hydrolase-like protein with peptidoglycan-binding domain